MTNPIVFQGMPNIGTPLVNPDGSMSLIWYRFFLALATKSGLLPDTNSGPTNRIGVRESDGRKISSILYNGGINASVGYYSSGSLHYLNAYDITTGQFIGRIAFTDWLGP